MKANELMTGDWVKVSDVPTNLESKIGKCGKVAKLEQYPNYSGIAIKFDNELDTYFCEKEEELEPIPITKEILKKNKFHFKPSWNQWWHYPDSIIGGSDLQLEYSNDGYELPDSSNIKIKYVHELQHLLRMVGVTKEIVL